MLHYFYYHLANEVRKILQTLQTLHRTKIFHIVTYFCKKTLLCKQLLSQALFSACTAHLAQRILTALTLQICTYVFCKKYSFLLCVKSNELWAIIHCSIGSTLYNKLLRIARNLMDTRENIKIESRSFYHIISWIGPLVIRID